MVFGNLPLLTLVKACRVTVALALSGLIFAGQALARESQPLDRVVAIVGAQNISDKELEPMVITQSEVDSMARPLLAQLARKGGGVDEQKVRKKVLDEIIMRRLRFQEAERLKIKISDQEVKALFDQMAKQNNLSPEQFTQ
ncbi:MAG: SurA N-terminal domain-containing protein, partial [Magnetococcales bacterium]|nr:SurA N-terminal domain-containing protein [Magnetococcales bacterium]